MARPSEVEVPVDELMRSSEAMMLPGGSVWLGGARAAKDLTAFLLMVGSRQCVGISPAREVLDHSCRSLAWVLESVAAGGLWVEVWRNGGPRPAGPKPPP